MKTQKNLILITIFVLLTTACNTEMKHNDIEMLENNKIYTVWENILSSDRYYCLRTSGDFIESLPTSLRIIIAHYDRFLPDSFMSENQRVRFMAALSGDMKTIEDLGEVQKNLSKDWDKVIQKENFTSFPNNQYPYLLKIRETGESVFFEFYLDKDKKIADEFKINKDGEITYIGAP
jgi:hypothetical protein